MYQIPPIYPYDPTATPERVLQYNDYYRVKYDICSILQPKRGAEIGVRAGYSSHAFLQACPDMEFYGIDANNGTHGGAGGESGQFKSYAISILGGYDFTYIECDTQEIDILPVGHLNFIHIDGDHTSSGLIHDFKISYKALLSGGYILIDDIDYVQTVKDGVDYIIDYYGKKIESIYLPSLRGEYLIRKK